jgi:hypothetical protein
VGTYASMAIALVHFAAGRYSECVTWARNLIEKSPGYPAGHMYLIAALAGQRRRFPRSLSCSSIRPRPNLK